MCTTETANGDPDIEANREEKTEAERRMQGVVGGGSAQAPAREDQKTIISSYLLCHPAAGRVCSLCLELTHV